MNITYTCPRCQGETEVDVTPPRPAPFCQNHDSTAFSDSGDPGELDPNECSHCHYTFTDEEEEILFEKANEQGPIR